jgi:hypothetical protein
MIYRPDNQPSVRSSAVYPSMPQASYLPLRHRSVQPGGGFTQGDLGEFAFALRNSYWPVITPKRPKGVRQFQHFFCDCGHLVDSSLHKADQHEDHADRDVEDQFVLGHHSSTTLTLTAFGTRQQ